MRIIKYFILIILLPTGTVFFTLTLKEMSDERELDKLKKSNSSKVISIQKTNDHNLQDSDNNYQYDDEGNITKFNTQKHSASNDESVNSVQDEEIENPIEELNDSDFETPTPKVVKIKEQPVIKVPKKTTAKKVKPVIKSKVVKLPVKPKATKKSTKSKKSTRVITPARTSSKTVTKAAPKFKKQTIQQKPKPKKNTSVSKVSPIIIQNTDETENDSDYDEEDDIFTTQTNVEDTEIIETKKEPVKKEFSSDPCKGRSARYIARCRHK